MLVTLSFDDGEKVQYTRLYPILEKYGLKATFYIVTSWVNRRGILTWQQIDDLHRHGNEIGGHTHTHPNLTLISDDQLVFELKKSRDLLKPFNATTLAYPFGRYNDKVIEYAKRYYNAARGIFSLSELRKRKSEVFRFNFGLEEERYKLKAIDPEFEFPPETSLIYLPFSKFRSKMTQMLDENIDKKVWVIFAFHGSWMVKVRKRAWLRQVLKDVAVKPLRIVAITKQEKDKLYWKMRTTRDSMRNFEWLCEQLSAAPLEVLNISEAINLCMKENNVS